MVEVVSLRWKYGSIPELRVVVLKWCPRKEGVCDDMRKFLLKLPDQLCSRLLRRPFAKHLPQFGRNRQRCLTSTPSTMIDPQQH